MLLLQRRLFSLHPRRCSGAHTHCSPHHRPHCVGGRLVISMGARRRCSAEQSNVYIVMVFFLLLFRSIYVRVQRNSVTLDPPPLCNANTDSGALRFGLHAATHRRARRLRTRHDVSLQRDTSWPGGEESSKKGEHGAADCCFRTGLRKCMLSLK